MKVGFIGCGNMGSVLAKCVALSGASVYVYDKDENKAAAFCEENDAVFASSADIAGNCEYVFLAVKPNIIPYAIIEIKNELLKNENCTLVSMAAGVSLSDLSERLPNYPIIRIMPNTPAAFGEGMILWAKNKEVSNEKAEGFLSIMKSTGIVEELEESKIDAASAISGCGPAFVYMFIEALADGGVECGLPRDLAQRLAAQTVLGAGKTVLKSGKHPGALKDSVCSPGGSTIAGVHALEDGAFRACAASAVRAAYEKTLLLGK